MALGTIIANRLPTREARPWRKALATWDKHGGLSIVGEKKPRLVPEVSWPIEAVLFVYPAKLDYGQGELILWELKLLGESADHGLFLELILPAMEEASSTMDSKWRRQNSLWGRFDIHAVYTGRGRQWEPVVQDGRLNLRCHVTPTQWAEGLSFDTQPERIFDSLTWLTPFDLDNASGQRGKIPPERIPTLRGLLEALIARMSQLLPGKHTTPDDVWALLSGEERARLQDALEQAALIPLRHHRLKPAPKECPGRWLGTQTFPSIPHPLIPYLELASILHIGRQAHFGCGTFMIT